MTPGSPTDTTDAVAQIEARLLCLADAEFATHSQGYFKTGVGEYGAGDRFLGIRMPALRRLVKEFKDTGPDVAETLLKSPFHEQRLFALLLLVARFQKGPSAEQELIYTLYLHNTRWINNWDLVDSSAHLIVGAWLETRDRSILYKLAKSDTLWERRIAIMATFHFIRQNDYSDALRLTEVLLHDPEDLIHKAVGWMLREIGNRDRQVESNFLQKHYQKMPRTMLRYAIEKFPEEKRQCYLKGLI